MSDSLGQRIRRAREREGLTQSALAKKVGVSQGAVAIWEGGQGPTEANKKKLEDVLGALSAEPQSKNTQSIAEDVSSFGSWLREQRTQKGLSVPELAKNARVSAPAVYNIESGKIQNPQSATRDRLAKALGMPIPEQVVTETVESQNVVGLGPLTDFQPHDTKEWPTCAGVYVLYDVSQRPIYVGKGDNIGKRLKVHDEKFWF